MRYRTTIFPALCLTLLGTSVAPIRADIASTKRAIQAVYAKMAAALQRQDLDAIAATNTKDFKLIQPDGQSMNNSQALQSLRQSMAMETSNTTTYTITSIKLSGNKEAVLVTRTKSVIIEKSTQGKSHTIVTSGLSRDHWIKTDRGWLMQSMQALPGGTETLDGKPVGGK